MGARESVGSEIKKNAQRINDEKRQRECNSVSRKREMVYVQRMNKDKAEERARAWIVKERKPAQCMNREKEQGNVPGRGLQQKKKEKYVQRMNKEKGHGNIRGRGWKRKEKKENA